MMAVSNQFLAEGIEKAEENGVFVTFEEFPDDIRKKKCWFKGVWNAECGNYKGSAD